MITIKAYKAQPTTKDEGVDDIALVMDQFIPDHKDLESAKRFHEQNAMWVYRALSRLPQGTLHELLIIMLQRKECLLKTQSLGEPRCHPITCCHNHCGRGECGV